MCKFCPPNAGSFRLAEPNLAMLAAYRAALAKGWSPDNVVDRSSEELEASGRDPAAFIGSKSDAVNADVAGRTFTLPDGAQVPRLPMRDRWIWDGDFVGRISLRYRPGTNELPASTLGHIGYGVVPWKRGQGHAKRALAHMLDEARELGLTEVTITCDLTNLASQRVITANGGRLKEQFVAREYSTEPKLRYFVKIG